MNASVFFLSGVSVGIVNGDVIGNAGGVARALGGNADVAVSVGGFGVGDQAVEALIGEACLPRRDLDGGGLSGFWGIQLLQLLELGHNEVVIQTIGELVSICSHAGSLSSWLFSRSHAPLLFHEHESS